MKQTLILIRGLPGAGKTTLARALFDMYLDSGHEVVITAADDYMVNVAGEYEYNRSKLPECHRWCQEDVHEFLADGYTVIVHNTFTQQWEANPYLEMAKEFDVPVSIIHVQGPWKNIHGCPDYKVEEMRKKWEPILL